MQHHGKLNENIDPVVHHYSIICTGLKYDAAGADMISFNDALSKTLYW
jgi:hypothetical protein